MPAQVAALSTPSALSALSARSTHSCATRTALAVSVCWEGRVSLTSCALRAVRRAGAAVAQDEGHLRHRDGHADGAGLRLGQAGEVAAELGGSEVGQRGGGRHLRSQGREFTGVRY